ncbi:hypothetical protein [Kineococcus sp. SYSU DK005]|uniref:hypothetical protein n=1 Tax=Kineococcus sp. SYSU DK005 TaxID=3383126 RepID=UPI003D7DD7CB
MSTSTPTTAQDVAALADSYEAALRRHLAVERTTPILGVGGIAAMAVREDPALDQALQELLNALRTGPDTAAVDEFEQAATAWLTALHHELQSPHLTATERAAYRDNALGRLHEVLAPLDRARSTFADGPALSAAQHAGSHAQHQLRQAQAEVQQAVAAGAVDALPALRRRAEIDAADALAEATEHYLQLTLARAEARAVPGRQRLQQASADVDELDEHIAGLERQLAAARADREHAEARRVLTARAAELSEHLVQRAAGHLRHTQEQLEQQRTERVRAYAGLPA